MLKCLRKAQKQSHFQEAQTASHATHCAMRLQTAGMYLVHVMVNGHPLSGWPKDPACDGRCQRGCQVSISMPFTFQLQLKVRCTLLQAYGAGGYLLQSCCRASLLQAVGSADAAKRFHHM